MWYVAVLSPRWAVICCKGLLPGKLLLQGQTLRRHSTWGDMLFRSSGLVRVKPHVCRGSYQLMTQSSSPDISWANQRRGQTWDLCREERFLDPFLEESLWWRASQRKRLLKAVDNIFLGKQDDIITTLFQRNSVWLMVTFVSLVKQIIPFIGGN